MQNRNLSAASIVVAIVLVVVVVTRRGLNSGIAAEAGDSKGLVARVEALEANLKATRTDLDNQIKSVGQRVDAMMKREQEDAALRKPKRIDLPADGHPVQVDDVLATGKIPPSFLLTFIGVDYYTSNNGASWGAVADSRGNIVFSTIPVAQPGPNGEDRTATSIIRCKDRYYAVIGVGFREGSPKSIVVRRILEPANELLALP